MNALPLLLLAWLFGAMPAGAGEGPTASPASPPATAESAAAFADTLVVTAARSEQRIADAVASTSVLTRADLAASADLTLDDQLRQIPGFSLLRRSSSLTAHPTSQGVSLRGLGPSGASRTLVLCDGSPMNDPFGGWVYWNRLPLSALESVEVARGALSQLYGSAALGGVIQLLPRAPRRDTLELRARGGEGATRDLEVFASDASDAAVAAAPMAAARSGSAGGWGYTLAGRAFRTGGFFVVSPADRGAVDRRAGVDFDTVYGRFERGGIHVSANAFREERENGTALQRNDTRIRALEAGWEGERWEWSLFGQSQRFRSTFSRILPDRSQEFLTARQDFATRGYGGSAAWHAGDGWLAGADLRRADWDGPGQLLGGAYGQRTFALSSRIDLLAGARVDLWGGGQSGSQRTSVNPRLGLLMRATDAVTLRASAYRGFRAPTLNELYRPFRVGNVETLANPKLQEETLVGAELGVDLHPSAALFARLDVYRNRIDGAVGNVTLSTTPQRITRQRRNLDRVTADGVEAEVHLRLRARWALQAAYLYTDSRVERTGLRVPQVPLHQGTAGITFDGPVAVLLQGRWVGEQFDDDLNQLPLRSAFVTDLTLRRPLSAHVEISLSAENLFDERVVTGRLPVEAVGAPRQVQVGLTIRR